ncbi:alpha/beta hydrolase [Flavobacterium sp. ZB4P23]|uniref:alpha/beta hydrolase n=1 Tax=unclassified Flavobacterium TaxID=196869 RepID=UPI000F8337F2|nr:MULTISPECIES: alpha/beta hydrolase [unclassified Flavobacterium]RTY83851.1 alpha/beta hydrolase [Flavobacterium sp. ZB4P23]RTY91212.1 alpha/beta hydrolase [Flavobacterium sp. RSP46]
MKKLLLVLLISCSILCHSQTETAIQSFNKDEVTINPLLNGSLYSPLKQNKKTNLVILIAGSGPTDRDGNQKGLPNNSLKYLSEELTKNDIAVFSYDKRIFAQMKSGTVNEATLTFDDFITDATTVLLFFKNQKKYNKIIIAGHSEGSLIGMIAANGKADAFISLAGAGRTIDAVLVEQIAKQAPYLKEEVQKNLDILKNGETFELKNPMLASLFRASIQPYMISWIKYNPQIEIAKLKIPVLLLNGTADLQVSVAEAELLKKAKPEAELVLIEKMNHIFKEINGDDSVNMKSYSNPDLPIAPKVVTAITGFIKSL